MPQMTERSFAWIAHLSGADPLAVLAASRVVCAEAIFLLIFLLGRNLGIPDPLAAIAGGLSTLASSHSQFLPGAAGSGPLFLRYFRTVSPGAHVALLLLTLVFLERITGAPEGAPKNAGSEKKGLLAAILTGVALGSLAYVPVYYPAFALIGMAWLILRSAPPARRDLLLALLISGMVAIPSALHYLRVMDDPDVAATIARYGLILPGRDLDPTAMRYFLVGVPFLAAVLLARRGARRAARFILPFLAGGLVLLLQDGITNRHIQSHHWMHCITPIWALSVALLWSRWPRLAGPAMVLGGAIALVAYGAAATASACRRLETTVAESPEALDLNGVMPETLHWLDSHTPPRTVVISSEEIMTQLVLFTHDKVYWSQWADQCVLSDSESMARQFSLDRWDGWPSGSAGFPPLAFHADYYLRWNADCAHASGAIPSAIYRNFQERTCVFALGKGAARSHAR
jgi:hypothetical protein